MNNLKQVGLAAMNYENTYNVFPPALNLPGATNWPAPPAANEYFSLTIALFSFFEQDNLQRSVVINVANPHYTNCIGPNSFGAQVVKILQCPSDSVLSGQPVGTYTNSSGTYYFGLSSYGGCSGKSPTNTDGSKMNKDGMFYINSSIHIADITDGTSNTFLFGERSRLNLPATNTSQSVGGWAWVNIYALEDNTMNTSVAMEGFKTHDLNAFGSQHAGGANFCFADGSVHFISATIDLLNVYQPLSTRAGGEVIPGSAY
jgi:prepilin-type processing-associated H-X9-DG protein